jgi:hypothetical protein
MEIRPAYHGERAMLTGPVWDATHGVFCDWRCAKRAGAALDRLTETRVEPGDRCACCFMVLDWRPARKVS